MTAPPGRWQARAVLGHDGRAGRSPPEARTLGWEPVTVEPERGTIEVAFDAGERFVNPAGVIQGVR